MPVRPRRSADGVQPGEDGAGPQHGRAAEHLPQVAQQADQLRAGGIVSSVSGQLHSRRAAARCGQSPPVASATARSGSQTSSARSLRPAGIGGPAAPIRPASGATHCSSTRDISRTCEVSRRVRNLLIWSSGDLRCMVMTTARSSIVSGSEPTPASTAIAKPAAPSSTRLRAAELQVWYQLQQLTWRHGCADPMKCTKDKHRFPCPPKCPKAARTSGRRHVCTAPDDPRLCRPGCVRHAATRPQRKSGGLVFRGIKERRRKTVKLAPELEPALRGHRAAQARERLAAGDLWQDHDLVFCQPDGRLLDPRRD